MAPYDSLLFEEEEVDTGPDLSEKLEDIESQFKSIQVPMLLPYVVTLYHNKKVYTQASALAISTTTYHTRFMLTWPLPKAAFDKS